MSMSRKDFEAIAGVIKAQHDTIVAQHKALSQGSPDEIKSYAWTQYESAAIALADVAQGLTNVFREANPLFTEWRFYEACGLKKFYTEPRSKRCGKDWNEVEGANMAYLYIPNGTFYESE